MGTVHAILVTDWGVCRASELKEELARLSLPTNGSRQQLEDRLMEHYQTAMQQDAQYEALSQQVHLPTQLLVQSSLTHPTAHPDAHLILSLISCSLCIQSVGHPRDSNLGTVVVQPVWYAGPVYCQLHHCATA